MFLINQVLTCTGQNSFQERHLNCWRHLEFNFRSPTIKFWPATLQDCASPNAFVYITQMYILFSQMKNVNKPFWPKRIRFWWVTQHGKFVYYGHNEFAEWPFAVTELQNTLSDGAGFQCRSKGGKASGHRIECLRCEPLRGDMGACYPEKFEI